MSVSAFHSYESLVSHFAEKTNVKLLPMTNGRISFLHEFGKWFLNYESNDTPHKVSYILPNPLQGLAFPTPNEILSAALLIGRRQRVDKVAIQNLLEEFGLNTLKSTQPIVSLSGGELLLLNYAKVKAMMPTVEGLVACSPTRWLNHSRYHYWASLEGSYSDAGKSIEIALLNGESTNAYDLNYSFGNKAKALNPLKWKLLVKEPRIVFPEIVFPDHHPESHLEFLLENGEAELSSPTLLTGDNGVGKTVLSKLLAGIIKPTKGHISLLSENGDGLARLIFQDSIDQIFGMSIDSHLDWVFRFDSGRATKAKELYSKLERAIRTDIRTNNFDGLTSFGVAEKRDTLLQAKICLVAERIVSEPPLLILDEPSWGLSKEISKCFVAESCKQAHEHGIAVVIITHQPQWWKEFVNTHIHLDNIGSNTTGILIRH